MLHIVKYQLDMVKFQASIRKIKSIRLDMLFVRYGKVFTRQSEMVNTFLRNQMKLHHAEFVGEHEDIKANNQNDQRTSKLMFILLACIGSAADH